MRVYQMAIDYQHIKYYGIIQGWTKELVVRKQVLAYHINAPFDCIDVENYKAILFRDLPKEKRALFWDIRENYFGLPPKVIND